MPEGHVIHRLARTFSSFPSHTVQVSSPQGRFRHSAKLLTHHHLVEAWAVGKHLFLRFEREEPNIVHVHLGLYGSWRFVGTHNFITPNPALPRLSGEHEGHQVRVVKESEWSIPTPRESVRLRIDYGEGVADLSGPNTCELISEDEYRHVLSRLGPDPLSPHADPEKFITRVRQLSRPIGALVMDQSVIAGPGNIYRSECLFRTGINPNRSGNRISVSRLSSLWEDLRDTMGEGVETGRIITMRAKDLPSPAPDVESTRFYVYHRSGRACLICGTTIKESNQAHRRLFWCPHCQR